MRQPLVAALFFLLSLYGVPEAAPQTSPGSGEAPERLEELKSRLKVTSDQQEKIKPILQKEAEQMKALRPEGGFASLSRRQKFKLAKQMKSIREASDKELSTVLSKDQMNELKKVRSEQKERMKEEFRARR